MCVTREIPNRQYPTSGQCIVAIIVDSVTVLRPGRSTDGTGGLPCCRRSVEGQPMGGGG